MWSYDFWLGSIWTLIVLFSGAFIALVGLYVWDMFHPEPPADDPWDEFFADMPPSVSNKEL